MGQSTSAPRPSVPLLPAPGPSGPPGEEGEGAHPTPQIAFNSVVAQYLGGEQGAACMLDFAGHVRQQADACLDVAGPEHVGECQDMHHLAHELQHMLAIVLHRAADPLAVSETAFAAWLAHFDRQAPHDLANDIVTALAALRAWSDNMAGPPDALIPLDVVAEEDEGEFESDADTDSDVETDTDDSDADEPESPLEEMAALALQGMAD